MSNVYKLLVKNTIWLSVAELVNGLLMFVLTVKLARYLAADNFGKIGFAISLATLLSVVVDCGFGTLAIREVARQPQQAKKYIDNIFTLRLLLGMGYIGLLYAVYLISHKETVILYLILLYGAQVVFQNLIGAIVTVYRSTQRMVYEMIGKITISVATFGLGIYFIIREAPLVAFGWMYALAAVAGLIVTIVIVVRNFFAVSLRIDSQFWGYLFRESWPYALSMIFISIYYFLDTVMLGFMKQDAQVGWYNAIYKIILFVLIFANVLGVVLFPQISALFKKSLTQLQALTSSFSKFIAIVALPIGFGGVILSKPLIGLIYGSEYLGGVTAFRFLIWTVVVIFFSIIFSNGLQACNRQRSYLAIVGLGAVMNIVLNLILIPRYSLNGAAVATLISELLVFVVAFQRFRAIVVVPFWRYVPKPLIASLGMSIFLVAGISWPVLLLIIGGVIVYGLLLYLIGGIGQNEWSIFRQLIKPKEPDETIT